MTEHFEKYPNILVIANTALAEEATARAAPWAHLVTTLPSACGPKRTFIPDAFAAVQPHQTGHSFMAQHFQAVEVVSARQAADRASVACLPFSAKNCLAASGMSTPVQNWPTWPK
ncbi:hypothetical protein NHN26_08130 [Rhodovulum tesquicola]|uniref:hypothetical protein n=1 Tax=Rhodovulum tesquicola TaxID=540254 RepID=UPI002097C90C|nr:hypothetical protein [Rhodovulum tesquicola]MCO8145192.1 hypothetical protein [Rhodovulum tesquicola]